MRSQCKFLQQNLQEEHTQRNNLERLILSLREQVAVAEAKVRDIENSPTALCKQELSRVSQELSFVKKEKDNLSQELERTHAQLNEVKLSYENLKYEMTHKAEQDREELSQQLESLKRKNRELSATAEKQDKVIKELDKEREQLKEYILKYENELKRQENTVKELEQDFSRKEVALQKVSIFASVDGYCIITLFCSWSRSLERRNGMIPSFL